MKFIVLTAFIAAALVLASAQSNHGFWGNIAINDTLVYSYPIRRSSSILQVVDVVVDYPTPVRSCQWQMSNPI